MLQKNILTTPLNRSFSIGTYDKQLAHQQAQSARRVAQRLGIELRTEYDQRNGSLMAMKLQGVTITPELYSYQMVLYIQAETRKKQRAVIEQFTKQKEAIYEQKITPTSQLSEAQQLAKRILDGETIGIDYNLNPKLIDATNKALALLGLTTKDETLTVLADRDNPSTLLFQKVRPEHD